ncbi:MAG: MarC family protein [Anaerohalosphaera sp.]|nr:MarC family protein [Anaerohalosphaera sp.]
MAEIFINTYVKMFFLLSPFFAVSMFLSMAVDLDARQKKRAAVRTGVSMLIAVLIFFFFGIRIFSVLGITLEAFQIGAGILLFRNAMMLVSGSKGENVVSDDDDFAVVPLALPLIVGPGSIGTLLVLGATIVEKDQKIAACLAIFAAAVTVGVFLYLATAIERLLGRKVLSALTKVTGLVLTSMAAQIVFTGVKTFMQ